MKRRLFVLAALASIAAAPAPWIFLSGGWTRPALAGGTAAGYLVIANHGSRPDRLIAASSPVAAQVSLHESRMVGSVMTMRAVDNLTIPAGGRVTLAPGGLHLMLEGLRRPLHAGEHVPLTLQFAGAGMAHASLAVGGGPASTAMPGMKM
jgi:copper(I)-binding protein